MTTPERTQPPVVESKSSVKLSLNAKGDVQIEVKGVVGDDAADLTIARVAAERHFDELRAKYEGTLR